MPLADKRRKRKIETKEEPGFDKLKNKMFFIIPIAIIVGFLVWYIYYYNKKKKLANKSTEQPADKVKYIDEATGKEVNVKLINAGLYSEKETS